jgi:XXXCH domain-containing protein
VGKHELERKEKYKTLKKRLSADLKALRARVTEERALPELDAFDRFCADARSICTYRGKGEPHYGAFLKCVEQFAEAFEGEDLDALESAIAALRQMKERCHNEYK